MTRGETVVREINDHDCAPLQPLGGMNGGKDDPVRVIHGSLGDFKRELGQKLIQRVEALRDAHHLVKRCPARGVVFGIKALENGSFHAVIAVQGHLHLVLGPARGTAQGNDKIKLIKKRPIARAHLLHLLRIPFLPDGKNLLAGLGPDTFEKRADTLKGRVVPRIHGELEIRCKILHVGGLVVFETAVLAKTYAQAVKLHFQVEGLVS